MPPLPNTTQAWGGHVVTIAEAAGLADYVVAHGGDGMMLWSAQKTGTPSANDLSAAVCPRLGLPSCAVPLQ